MRYWYALFLLILLVLALIIIALFQIPDANLHIIACDVGQGDAILTIYKNVQILTDGGPDKRVINCLGRHLPFWDRTIELVVSTHPDADHSTGLVEVIKRYKVSNLMINPIDAGTQVYKVLKNEVGSKRVKVISPQDGMSVKLKMIQLDILSPSEELYLGLDVVNQADDMQKYTNVKNTNLYSITYLISFGKFRGLFTGDIPPEVSEKLAADWSLGNIDYIKIPHHGSINGLTRILLEKTRPKVGVISVGNKNMWNFPSLEIVKMLDDYNVKVLRTDLNGDAEITTDGQKTWIKK